MTSPRESEGHPRGPFVALLSDPGMIRRLNARFYSALPRGVPPARFDRRPSVYDAVVGRSLYHRFVWGTSPRAYARFARLGLEAAGGGHFAEAGCGTLLFTARMYRDPRPQCCVLLDRSIGMLRRAARRLPPEPDGRPDAVVLLHGDMSALPFRSGALSSLLSLNVLHVPCDVAQTIAEFSRVLEPGRGHLFVSALVRSGRWSDAYMNSLHASGDLGPPLSIDQLQEQVAGTWADVESMVLEGNMCYLIVRHRG